MRNHSSMFEDLPMVKIALRQLLFTMFQYLGVNAVCRYLNRHKAAILYYHGVCSIEKDTDNAPPLEIPEHNLQAQLTWLTRMGYTFISLTDLVQRLNQGQPVGRHVAITFDDGFHSVVETAHDCLRREQAYGCCYVVADRADAAQQTPDETNSFDKDNGAPYNIRTASWDELLSMDAETMEIGSHTRTHPNCTSVVDDAELVDEIVGSRREIEENLGRNVSHFCYPNGDYSHRITSQVRTAGYDSAVTTRHGLVALGADVFTLPRIIARPEPLFFAAEMSGAYEILIDRNRRAINRVLKLFGL
jgi:peptidoglycan/xylan/chitin deacetylase (PgdA/CDA1 family)